MSYQTSDQKPRLKLKKGLWSPDEDQKLTCYVMNYGHSCWTSVPINAGLQRNGKSCRLRWINYLRPGLKRGAFSSQEEETILTLHGLLGNRWSQISQHLPGRTDNEIKNYWNSHLKKRIVKSDYLQKHPNLDCPNTNMASTSSSSCMHTSNFTNSSSGDIAIGWSHRSPAHPKSCLLTGSALTNFNMTLESQVVSLLAKGQNTMCMIAYQLTRAMTLITL